MLQVVCKASLVTWEEIFQLLMIEHCSFLLGQSIGCKFKGWMICFGIVQ
jgi:hypothetical protein